MTTTTFFSLPRELRDCVYKHVIYTPCRPPATPRHAGLRLHESRNPSGKDWDDHHILYPLDARPDAYIMPLLQCNRQIRREVHEALSRAKAHSDGSCKLDLMFGRCTLVPTWVGLPFWPDSIRHLEIGIRIFDRYITPNLFARVFNLLMHHGPQFGYSNLQQGAGLHLETLTIKIAFDEGVQPECKLGRARMEENYYTVISHYFRELFGADLLFGVIDQISIRLDNSDHDYEAQMAKKKDPDYIPGDPAEFERLFGLRWGVDPSLKLSDWLNKGRWVESRALFEDDWLKGTMSEDEW
ncbi:hypothetical protein G7Y79_00050g085950 [Physcia stellaris]|nr:hypothetical protein G7Y79_00050g085950 [Physcia stellaris]